MISEITPDKNLVRGEIFSGILTVLFLHNK